MFTVLVVAIALSFSGSIFLRAVLNSREHPIWFALFWAICAWLTLTAMLLAIFDLLMLKSEARKAERELRERLKTDSPRSTTGE